MELDVSSEIKRFNEHLSLKENRRIMFSGIFGIGKTYFLEKFFKEKDELYEVFFIKPVNYSISKNDDIIHYLKYDISFELFKKDIKFEKMDFSIYQTLPYALKDNVIEVINTIAKNSGKIGKSLKSFINITKNIIDHNEDLKINEKEVIEKFLKNTTLKENSIYHENLITELISNKIQSFNNRNKKTVLIIDDLDRIDPEHIFRLLNVFASHIFDRNKFGFSKIVLVCDIVNVRNIFSKKYGQDTDFSGYIDKFFSDEIYMFDNKKIITSSIINILNNIKIASGIESNPFLENNSYSSIIFRELLDDFVKYDIINLRALLKNVKREIKIPYYIYNIGKMPSQSNYNNPMIVIFDLLKLFFGSLSSLEVAIEKYYRKEKVIEINRFDIEKYGILIVLVDIKNNKSEKGTFTYKNKEQNIIVEYDIVNHNYINYGRVSKVMDLNIRDNKVDFPLSFLIKEAFNEYLYIHNNKILH